MVFAPPGGMMRRLRHPLPWILILMAASFCTQELVGGLEPQRLPDTASYERMARFESLELALGHVRTLGYPVLLRIAEEPGVWLKRFEYGAYLLAVLAFWWALTVWFRSGWIALAGAVPLLWADVIVYLGWLQPDALAAAGALITVAATILVAARWRPSWSWSVLTVGVLLTCLLRPAYLFLVPLVPFAGVVMRGLRASFRGSAGFGLRLTAASAGPVLGFCLLRWLVVGQLGFVSFLGYNLSGIAAGFLHPQLVRNLPAEQQPIADSVLAWRQAHGMDPYRGHMQVARWHDDFTSNIWRATVPAAERSLARRPESAPTRWMAIDDRLREWSLEVLRRNPPRYLRWVRGSVASGLSGLFERPTLIVPAVLLVFSVPVLLAVRRSPRGAETRALIGLGVLCGGYFLFKLLLLATVSVPFDRYLDAAVLLLPTLLWVELALVWRVPARIGLTHPLGIEDA